MNSHRYKAFLTIPNLLTEFRFVCAPILLMLAWYGCGNLFLLLLALTFLSDVLDGFAARLLGQESELGALLDSWGDLLIYSTVAVSAWWLWPNQVIQQKYYMVAVVFSFIAPVLCGIYKFHALTSYHTWLVKAAVVCTGCSLFLLFLFEIAWPFRISAIICLLSAFEEIAITRLLSNRRSNVRSIWHVKHNL